MHGETLHRCAFPVHLLSAGELLRPALLGSRQQPEGKGGRHGGGLSASVTATAQLEHAGPAAHFTGIALASIPQ